MRRLALIPLLILPCVAVAQTDDRSFLTAFLEDNLSGAGRKVTITGFEGALSSQASLTELTIADDKGVWITLRDVTLDWSRSALLSGRVEVSALTAGEILLDRLPDAGPDLPAPEATGFALPDLPVSVEIGRIAAERIALGAPVLGTPVEGLLDASMTLAGGEGQARLTLKRTDAGPEGRVALTASYANDTRRLMVDLEAQEARGGIATTLLGIPDAPSVDLSVKGDDLIDDFTATVALASDGADRLAGTVTLQSPAGGDMRFAADLGGDLAPLFLPDYAAFFGPEVRLATTGTRSTSGRLTLDRLSLATRSLALDGSLSLAPDGLPDRFAVTGRLRSPDGEPVLLPLTSGPRTRVADALVTLSYDAAAGEGWRGSATVQGVDRPDLRIARLALTGSGRIGRMAGGRVLGGTLRFDAAGLEPTDAGLAEALGPQVTGQTTFHWRDGEDALSLPQLSLTGEDYGLEAGGRIAGLGSGLSLTGRATLRAADLSRAAGLAGRPLAGRALAEVQGTATLLGGGFDLTGRVTGTDLRIGQPEVDSLLRGDATITLSARRDQTGTTLRQLDLAAGSLSASVTGRIATAGSDLAADLSFSDLAALGGGYRGSAQAQARFAGTPQSGRLTLAGTAQDLRIGQPEADRVLAGQSRLSASLEVADRRIRIEQASVTNPQVTLEATGLIDGSQRKVNLSARLANLGLLVPEFPGPATVSGTAVEDAQGYRLDLSGTGPGQIRLKAAGRLAPGLRTADVGLSGSAQAGLANAFLRPRAVSGPVSFDLRLNGPLRLGSVSGRIGLTDGRITDPSLGSALEGVSASADLAGGRARITAAGRISTGGQVQVGGTVGLTAPFAADLDVTLTRATLRDPRLFEARLGGALAVTGPLTGGATISGGLLVTEAEVQMPQADLAGAGTLPDLRHVNEPAAVRETRRRAGLIGGDAGGGGEGRARPFGLDLTITAPNRLFLRGRGLDAELGGELRLGGTTDAVVPSGAFDLIRGRLDILGKRLTLSEASLRVEGDFDPYVSILASNESDGITSSVRIEGRATEPVVSFVSVPELPEEEVLARLLFGRDLTSLSAFQAAQLAGAVATLAGRGGEGIVGRLRKGFDLDDLDIATSEDGGTSLKVGKYLSRNLYTEITVDEQGQSQINLNLDVTRDITVRGRTDSTGETGIGVFIEKDY